MSDAADDADLQVVAFAAAAAARRKPEGPKATGNCLYCNSALPHGVRWCDTGCKGDWELEQEAKQRNWSKT